MPITFRIAPAADDRTRGQAVITARQLAAFRHFLTQEGSRTGIVLIDPEAAELDHLAYQFEARVCPIALARFARLFDYDDGVIGVIDEAQFRWRRVSIYRDQISAAIVMSVSMTSDIDVEITLAKGNASALPESPGLNTVARIATWHYALANSGHRPNFRAPSTFANRNTAMATITIEIGDEQAALLSDWPSSAPTRIAMTRRPMAN